MRASTYFVLSLLGAAHGLPTFLAEIKRALISISPDINLGLNLSNDNSCLGLGVSVCDPITVNSTTNSTAVNNNGSKAKPVSTSDASDASNDTSSGDDSLIDISPKVGLDLGVSNDNSCLGLGISACDPITVGSDVTKSSTNNDDSSSEESSVPSSTADNSNSDSSSGSSNGGGLLDLSPTVSPDVNLHNDNSCQGIGISACDPITVNSTTSQTSNNSD
ncbi:hypothetical protein F5Y13DRAFT_21342 [Hypoxylon sp. FL1857]|nr:hypothetical protein F5Y13DRAFT_21342 [Hypoxylon sp. FL1857]